ncbi:DUF805 domain-containing protein [Aureimonas sp. AU12]|uniref:DUF805 domain-containing protein n=1 Tax=Aureimonas sp. AU12 TaxID=1638161 RepID=UPI000785B713|nr:DUF805 domain-containing protein [Aureimonas sp. AU12]
MSYQLLFLDFHGRIGRKWFWIASLCLVALQAAAGFAVDLLLPPTDDPVPTFTEMAGALEAGSDPTGPNWHGIARLVAGILVWMGGGYVSLAISAKRWHDRGKSGWWQLLLLVPVIGFIWVLVDTGFLKGTDGPNRFGPDPLVDPVAALDGA